ncbi:hypothetical protein [Brevibacterium album]|uniref:hypothetical protein n=1 Tax=Brevibacterium album TaxID=417948 RepID=UPI000405FCD7|nr:hypothetical protein [Brevibacterium album]
MKEEPWTVSPSLTLPVWSTPQARSSTGFRAIGSAQSAAIDLFIEAAKAQPFQDGNKRSALFAANAHLIGHGTRTLLTVPVSETDPEPAERFNDLLARAYIFDEHGPVAALLRQDGLVSLDEIGSRRRRRTRG